MLQSSSSLGSEAVLGVTCPFCNTRCSLAGSKPCRGCKARVKVFSSKGGMTAKERAKAYKNGLSEIFDKDGGISEKTVGRRIVIFLLKR